MRIFFLFITIAVPSALSAHTTDQDFDIYRDAISSRLPDDIPPVIGCWFWIEEEFKPGGYRKFIDMVSKYTAYNLLITTMRVPDKEITDKDVHEQIKEAAAYARKNGMGVVLELDVRHSLGAFQKAYPDALQERLRLREVELSDCGEVIMNIGSGSVAGDAIGRYPTLSSRLVRVYSYICSSEGIEPDTVQDITEKLCKVKCATAKELSVVICCSEKTRGRKACVIASFTHLYPAVFAPHLIKFERDTVKKYADVDLAGLCKDEWGFIAAAPRGNPDKNDYWYSKFRAQAYAKRTGGRELVRDCLLMWKGERGRQAERQAAINHFMEMNWQRNGEIECEYYRAAKEYFGLGAFVGTHPTTFSYSQSLRTSGDPRCRLGEIITHLPVVTYQTKYTYPDSCEFERNGLDWWVVRRDFAQTDYMAPYCVRSSLAKKWGGAVWYNMYFSRLVANYTRDIWAHALAGGRMNFHPVFPYPNKYRISLEVLLRTGIMRGDCRIRLLNFISESPIDCPVAIIFGHACAMNWTGPAYEDVGIGVANGLWRAGFYADLIPSSEIGNKALQISDDGYVKYGPQRYSAVVLYHPQFERAETATFFQEAACGKTSLYRVGDWTRDFGGKQFYGNSALPSQMVAFTDVNSCIAEVIEHLCKVGIEAHTPATRRMAGHACPVAKGRCRLIDGTEIIVSGENQVTGDPIQTTFNLKGQKVKVDAVGVVGVRVGDDGSLEAMAAGGLRYFEVGRFKIKLEKPADIALWRDEKGKMQGVLQDWDGPIPAALTAITPNWLRLVVPANLSQLE